MSGVATADIKSLDVEQVVVLLKEWGLDKVMAST